MSYYDAFEEVPSRIEDKQRLRAIARVAEEAIDGKTNLEALAVMTASPDKEVQWHIATVLAERFLEKTPTTTEIWQMLRFPL